MKLVAALAAAWCTVASAITQRDAAPGFLAIGSRGREAVLEALHMEKRAGDINWMYVGIGAGVVAVLIIVIAIVVVVKQRAAAARKKTKADKTLTLAPRFKVPAAKWEDFKAMIPSMHEATMAEDEGLLFYGFALDEANHVAFCREQYTSADGIKRHLKSVDDRLKEMLQISSLESLELHGPAEEVKKLKDVLTPMGCRYFLTDEGSRLHSVQAPTEWGVGFLDHHVQVIRHHRVPAEKLSEFKTLFSDFYCGISIEQYGLLFYGVSVNEENGVVVTREACQRAKSVQTILSDMQATLTQAAQIGMLESVEVHGPEAELAKLTEAFAGLGCKFFALDERSLSWAAGADFDVSDIPVSKLLKQSGEKLVEQLQTKVEKGSRAREIVEARAMCFQDKAKDFVIKSMNDVSKDLLRAIDAEEAATLIEFNQAVETSFPPITVLLAGVLSPLVLSMSYTGHVLQLVILFVPVLVLTTWAILQDFGAVCDIPTMQLWIFVAFAISLIQVAGHASLVVMLRSGRNKLKAKTAEISERIAINAADGETSMSDIQDFFIGSTILVQEALLVEDGLRRSMWVDAVGVSNLLWIVAVIWNFVIVVGWTFVPGTIAFHEKAHTVAAGDFCGAWASVFTARVVCLLTPLFFFLNLFSAATWIITKLVMSNMVSKAVLSAAESADQNTAGIPVAQTLVKAFLLRASQDAKRAKLMVALGEKLRLSKERIDAQGQLNTLKRRIDSSKLERKLMKKLMQEQGDSMEDNIKILEKAGAENTSQWKTLGAELAQKAEKRAAASQKVATDQLDKVVQYITQLAEQVQNSEAFKAALEKAKEAAQEAHALADKAQEAAAEGLAEAQHGLEAGIAYAQSDEARAAMEKAREMATHAAETGMSKAQEAAAFATSDEAQAALANARDTAVSKASAAASYAQSDEARAAVQGGLAQATQAAKDAQKTAIEAAKEVQKRSKK